jgi:murein DD-endopeptidase MepM/ murein hydrolase activator NlpD
MNAEDFNRAEIVAGRLTVEQITILIIEFQKQCGFSGTTGPKALDGKAGPGTRAELDRLLNPPPPRVEPAAFKLILPLPLLPGGRKAVVTSSFKPPDRPKHLGVDLFYPWRQGDRPDFVGDKGAAGKTSEGTPRWVVPYEVEAIAAADGVVQVAGNSNTGFRCWIDHLNGLRTGYFHLLNLRVVQGQEIAAGTPLGRVGDNPADHDGRHLHFELSPVNRYDPMDPMPFLM